MDAMRRIGNYFRSFLGNRDDDQSTEMLQDVPLNTADEVQHDEDVLTFSFGDPQYYIFKEALDDNKQSLLDNGVSYTCFHQNLEFSFRHAVRIPDNITANLSDLRNNITQMKLDISEDQVEFVKSTEITNFVTSKLVGHSRLVRSDEGEYTYYLIVGETKEVVEQCLRRIKSALKQVTFQKKNGNLRFFETNLRKAENELRKQHKKRILFVRSYMPHKLKIVCTDDIVQSVKEKVGEHLRGNVQKKMLKITIDEKSYIETQKQEQLKDLQKSLSSEVTFQSENANCYEMQIEGLKMAVESLETYIKNIQAELVTRMVPFLKLEDSEHLKHNEQQFCTYLASEAKCICRMVQANVLHAAENNNEWPLWQRSVSIFDKKTMSRYKKYDSIHRIRLLHMNHSSSEDDKTPDVKLDSPSLPEMYLDTRDLVVPYKDGNLNSNDFKTFVFVTLKAISEESGKCFVISLNSHFEGSVQHLTNAFLTAVGKFFEKEVESSVNHMILQTTDASLDLMKEEVVSLSKAQIGRDKPVPTIVMTGPSPMVYEIDVMQHFEVHLLAVYEDLADNKNAERKRELPTVSADKAPKKRKFECDPPGMSSDESISSYTPTRGKRSLYGPRTRSAGDIKAEEGGFAKVDPGLHMVATSETIITKCSKSIGFLLCYLPNNESIQGTCFRVGNNKIMTACHVLEKKLAEVDSSFEKQALLDRDVSVIFNFKHEKEREILPKFQVKWPPSECIPEIDIIILELKPSTTHLPNKLIFQVDYSPSTIHFIGHHSKDPQTFDPSCRVIQQSEVKEAKDYAAFYFSRYPDGFRDIDSNNYFRCHSSASFGASGCPGFMVERDSAYVIGVLVKGYPSFYPDLNDLEKASYPPHYRIEAAVTPRAIFDNLQRKNRNLCDEIF